MEHGQRSEKAGEATRGAFSVPLSECAHVGDPPLCSPDRREEWGIVPPRIHDLVKLLSLLVVRDAKLGTLGRRLASLSNYAVDYRYPGDNATGKQALAALRHAETVRKEIRKRLGLPP
jgi:HEPN domain